MTAAEPFADRTRAGHELAEALEQLRGSPLVVLGLPRGGVPVAFEVASHLGAPLDVIVVRKLGLPEQPELAMGAIGEGGIRILNSEVLADAAVPEAALLAVEATESAELARRVLALRGGRPAVDLRGKVAVIVDDGIATGATVAAACDVARHLGAQRVVVAVPVAPSDVVALLERSADEVIALMTPEPFQAVGRWYDDFRATTDDEVEELLARAASSRSLDSEMR